MDGRTTCKNDPNQVNRFKRAHIFLNFANGMVQTIKWLNQTFKSNFDFPTGNSSFSM